MNRKSSIMKQPCLYTVCLPPLNHSSCSDIPFQSSFIIFHSVYKTLINITTPYHWTSNNSNVLHAIQHNPTTTATHFHMMPMLLNIFHFLWVMKQLHSEYPTITHKLELWKSQRIVLIQFSWYTDKFRSQLGRTHSCHISSIVWAVSDTSPNEVCYPPKASSEPHTNFLQLSQGAIIKFILCWYSSLAENRWLTVFKVIVNDVINAIEGKDLKEWPAENECWQQWYKFHWLCSMVLADWLHLYLIRNNDNMYVPKDTSPPVE